MQKEIKVQTNLDNFFISKSSNYSSSISSKLNSINTIKKYFYLSWTNKYKPDFNAFWTNKKPEKINFVEQINCDYIKIEYIIYINVK